MTIPGNYLSETASTIDPNASGWVAHLNCTIGRGIGGSVTNGCLFMKSVAAGEMQCRTVVSYPVTPGTEYAVFADASCVTVPERIGIRWLDASSAQISITWSGTTLSATSTWHRIAVADRAPAGAAFAQVIFSSTPSGAAVSSYFDWVYFGLPKRTTGNLLSANAETSERASDWEYTAVTNCTLSRTVPPVGWTSTSYTAGGHVATMTVTANGNADFRSTDRPTVTPGQEYLAYAYLNPPSTSSTAWIELRFYDAALTQIQATRAVLDEPGTGWYRQRVSDVAPAGAAYATVAFGLTGATAGQLLRTDSAVITVAPTVRDGSVMPYEDSTFEQGVGAWTTVSGAAVLSRLSPWGTDGLEGSYCLKVASATATTSVIRSAKYPVTAGLSWRAIAGFKVQAGSWTLTRTIRWYNAAGTELSAFSGAPGAVPTPNWWDLFISSVAPADATQAAIEYTLVAGAAASELRIDAVALVEDLPLVTATIHSDTASVTLTLRDAPVGDTITVWRVTSGGTRTLVRGTDGLIDGDTVASATLVVEDYEAPIGAVFSYSAETMSGTLRTRAWASGDLTLPVSDPSYCWIKDPANPQRNCRVVAVTAPDWERPITQAENRVRGRRNSVILSDVRGGLEGDLVVRTHTDDERDALHWVLDSGNVLLLQFAPGLGIADTYVNIGQTAESRVTPYGGELRRLWSLPLKQADMPVATGIAGSAGRTWQDVLTENASWGDLPARYATWEDVLLNRPKAG